jgi:hypothetical protein
MSASLAGELLALRQQQFWYGLRHLGKLVLPYVSVRCYCARYITLSFVVEREGEKIGRNLIGNMLR